MRSSRSLAHLTTVLVLCASLVEARADLLDGASARPEWAGAGRADDSDEPDHLSISVGAFIPYTGKVTRFEAGNVTFADQILPVAGLEYRQRWEERFPGFALVPQFWITPLGQTLEDGAGRSRWMSAALLLAKQERSTEFRAGGGWLLQWVSGAGGESVQQNGSSTETYALPDRNVIVRMLTLQAGFGYQGGRLRFSADVIGTGILSSRRTANVVFAVGFGFR